MKVILSENKITHLERMGNWTHKTPTMVKVLKMAGLILGIALLTAPFFTAFSLGIFANACLVNLSFGF